MIIYDDTLYVNSIGRGQILVVEPLSRAVRAEIDHPHFNKPHSLCRSANGFLVASTGLDSIVEITENGTTLFAICLVDHGYPLDQFGYRRRIDWSKNHQRIVYPSLRHTTHVNYARYIDKTENIIIASLFHPGQIVKIDKLRDSIDVVVGGLKQPHAVYDFDAEHYLVCDSGHNRVLLINRETHEITESISGEFSWVQDAVVVDGDFYIADADNCRIVRTNRSGRFIDAFPFPSEYRIYQMVPLSEHEIALFG